MITSSAWGGALAALPLIVVVVALLMPAPSPPNPLIKAAVHGRLAELDRRSVETTLDDVRDDHGNTLLHWAAKAGQVDVCRYLIDRRTDPAITNRAGTTALHWAVYSPEHGSDIIEILLNAGVNPNSINHNRESALHWAVDWDRPNSVEALLRHGADPNLVDNHGDGPLHRIQRDCTESSSCAATLKLLLKHGANAAAVNDAGRAALAHIDWDYDATQKETAASV